MNRQDDLALWKKEEDEKRERARRQAHERDRREQQRRQSERRRIPWLVVEIERRIADRRKGERRQGERRSGGQAAHPGKRRHERRWQSARFYFVEKRKGKLWQYGSIAVAISMIAISGLLLRQASAPYHATPSAVATQPADNRFAISR